MTRESSLSSLLRRSARQIKRCGRLVLGRDVLYRYDARPRKRLFGTTYGGWTVAPEGLSAAGVMFSFGVGNDISFDLEMIEKFGMTVHGFDPSPTAVKWIASRKGLPDRYFFHPYGLGRIDGDVEFFSPDSGGMYSLTQTEGQSVGHKTSLPVKRLSSIIDALETRYIDILKLDIEGEEYGQIDAILECGDRIGQLLIEFHHRIGAAPLKETVRCVNRLREAGFRLFHVSGTSSEFSFLRQLR